MNASRLYSHSSSYGRLLSAAQPANAVKELPRPGGPSTSPQPPPIGKFDPRPSRPPDPGRPGTRGQAEDMKSVCNVAPPCPSGCSADPVSHKCTEWQAP